MTKLKKLTQLTFSIDNKPGLLAEITAKLTKEKVNILSICAYECEGKAYFILTTDKKERAKKVLSTFSSDVKEEKAFAIELPNRVGELEKVAKKIAENNIDIKYIYGVALEKKSATCILTTQENKKVEKLL